MGTSSKRSEIVVLLAAFFSAFLAEYSESTDIRTQFKDICQHLIELDVETFMEKSVGTFEYFCKSMSASNYLGYRNLYNDMLATTFGEYNKGSLQFSRGTKPGLCATNNVTTFVLEFAVGQSGSYALTEIEKYKDEYYGSKKDILCVGINFLYEMAPTGAKKTNASMIDRLKCDWEAKLYSDTGELKKTLGRKEVVLDCP